MLVKTNLDGKKGSSSRSLTGSYIEWDYFHLIYLLREDDYMKKEINKPLKFHKLIKTFNTLIKQCDHIIVWSVKQYRR